MLYKASKLMLILLHKTSRCLSLMHLRLLHKDKMVWVANQKILGVQDIKILEKDTITSVKIGYT